LRDSSSRGHSALWTLLVPPTAHTRVARARMLAAQTNAWQGHAYFRQTYPFIRSNGCMNPLYSESKALIQAPCRSVIPHVPHARASRRAQPGSGEGAAPNRQPPRPNRRGSIPSARSCVEHGAGLWSLRRSPGSSNINTGVAVAYETTSVAVMPAPRWGSQ